MEIVLTILTGIVFAALGAFFFFKPELVWKITEEWKSYSAGDPSDLYLKSTKFGGVLFMLGGIAFALLPLILK